MVALVEGRADRSSYRRFKVLDGMGNDDFRSMEEVVRRRYGRLRMTGNLFRIWWWWMENWPGGGGTESFYSLEIELPALIGLAKREETIVFP